MSSRRVAPIQWLRALAATLVVGVHAANLIEGGPVRVSGPFIPSVPNLAVFGVSGVDLFFVISGFVMAQALSQSHVGPLTFLRQRWLRIVPLFALVSAAYLLIETAPLPLAAVLMSVTVLPIFDGAGYHQPALYVGWTLGFEFAFYAVVALAIRAPRHRIAALLASTTSAALIGGVVNFGWAPVRLLFNPLMLEFALGITVWILWRRGITSRIAAPALVSGIALLAIGIAVGLGPFVSGDAAAAVAGTTGFARSWTWGLPWALVVTGMIDTRPAGRVEQVIAHVGDASYSTYLIHPCLIALLWRIGPDLPDCSAGAFVTMFVVVSTLAGLAVHRSVERPLLTLIARRRAASVGETALA